MISWVKRGIAPLRVQTKALTLTANSWAMCTGLPFRMAAQNEPVNESPAPTVSATLLWRVHKRHATGREHVTAVDAAREDEHIQFVFANKQPALVFQIDARITEHTTDDNEFFIVDFQYVATLHHRLADDPLV